jgi:hypothetical protein
MCSVHAPGYNTKDCKRFTLHIIHGTGDKCNLAEATILQMGAPAISLTYIVTRPYQGSDSGANAALHL